MFFICSKIQMFQIMDLNWQIRTYCEAPLCLSINLADTQSRSYQANCSGLWDNKFSEKKLDVSVVLCASSGSLDASNFFSKFRIFKILYPYHCNFLDLWYENHEKKRNHPAYVVLRASVSTHEYCRILEPLSSCSHRKRSAPWMTCQFSAQCRLLRAVFVWLEKNKTVKEAVDRWLKAQDDQTSIFIASKTTSANWWNNKVFLSTKNSHCTWKKVSLTKTWSNPSMNRLTVQLIHEVINFQCNEGLDINVLILEHPAEKWLNLKRYAWQIKYSSMRHRARYLFQFFFYRTNSIDSWWSIFKSVSHISDRRLCANFFSNSNKVQVKVCSYLKYLVLKFSNL